MLHTYEITQNMNAVLTNLCRENVFSREELHMLKDFSACAGADTVANALAWLTVLTTLAESAPLNPFKRLCIELADCVCLPASASITDASLRSEHALCQLHADGSNCPQRLFWQCAKHLLQGTEGSLRSAWKSCLPALVPPPSIGHITALSRCKESCVIG